MKRKQATELASKEISSGPLEGAVLDDASVSTGFAEASAGNQDAVEISSASFDAGAEGLHRTWHSFATNIFCINAYSNGVTFSLHRNKVASSAEQAGEEVTGEKYGPSDFHLRLKETRDYLAPEGRYYLFKKEPLAALEKKLALLHEQGVLAGSVCYFGSVNDPFLAFHRKFDLTMACMELLERYRPGLLVVQTRSPMVISALPLLKSFGKRGMVTIPIETRLESAVQRYSPGQPKIAERILAAQGIRRQGVEVNLSVSPILPYGDFHRDAWTFAEMLQENADFVTFGCLASGGPEDEQKLRALEISQKLVSDRRFRLLRPYAYRHVYNALAALAPEKLTVPVRLKNKPAQLSMFAA